MLIAVVIIIGMCLVALSYKVDNLRATFEYETSRERRIRAEEIAKVARTKRSADNKIRRRVHKVSRNIHKMTPKKGS